MGTLEETTLKGDDGRPEPTVPHRGATGRQRRQAIAGIVLLADAFVLTVSLLVAYVLRFQVLGTSGIRMLSVEAWVILLLPLVWLFFLQRFGCYRAEYLNATADAYRRYVGGVLTGVVAVGFISFIFRLSLSRGFVLLIAGSALVLGSLSRLWIRRWITRQLAEGQLRQPMLIVGVDAEAVEVARAVGRSPRSGYEVAGFLIDVEAVTPAVDQSGLDILGTVDDLDRMLAELGVGVVLVAPTAVTAGTLQRLMERLEGSEIGLAVAPSLFQVVTRRVAVESVANVPILHIDQIRLDRWKAFQKRTLDLVGASVGLVLLSPLLAFIALGIKLHDRGPVLFRQERVGMAGENFQMLKFRSMVVDAEQRLAEIAHLNQADGHFFKVQDDPRVTRLGRFIRKWSIDELPQLWNVVRGDMSLVGPRPPLPREVAEYEAWHRRRLRTRPGLTGVWQTSGRSEVSFDEAVRMDIFYIENWSLGFDLFLLLKTVGTVLSREGAY